MISAASPPLIVSAPPCTTLCGLLGVDVADQLAAEVLAAGDVVVAADHLREDPRGPIDVAGVAHRVRADAARLDEHAVVAAGQPASGFDVPDIAGYELAGIADEAEHLVVAAAIVRHSGAADEGHVAVGVEMAVAEMDDVAAAGAGARPRRDTVRHDREYPGCRALRPLGGEDHVVAFEEAPEAGFAIVEGWPPPTLMPVITMSGLPLFPISISIEVAVPDVGRPAAS